MPPNILIISSRADTGGGGEHYIQSIVKIIDRTRYIPIVALPSDGTLKPALEEHNIEVIILDSDYGWIMPDEKWYMALSKIEQNVQLLVSYINKKDIKLIHTNTNLRWEGALAANLAGIHHIFAIRVDFDPDHYLYKRFNLSLPSFARIMSALSTFILSVSKACAESLTPSISESKIKTINNGVIVEIYDEILNSEQQSIRQELNIANTSPLITAIGRIAPDKGFDIYLDAAISILQSHPTTHFLIVGSEENKPFTEILFKKVEENFITQNFHFLGYRNDAAKILATSDIFVLSSRHEGQSNALLEAMACECAVIATRCSGVEDAIINRDCGLIIDIDNKDAMIKAITHLLENPSTLTKYAQSARKRIKTHFNINDKIKELMQLYDETLALPSPASGSPEIQLFLNTANEIASLGLKNIELEKRLRRVEHIADLIQTNPLSNGIRFLRNKFKK